MKVVLEQNMTNEEAIGFYTKMNLVRADLLALDWKDDKFLSLGGRSGYNYLSIDKIKRNIAPVLQARGIDLGIEYCDLTQLGDPNAATQHWIITLKASLIDISTGFERVYTAFGESSDHGDKGVNKAQTAAMKQFLSNTFMLIDGVDPDAEDKPIATGSFTKTPTETLVAKSKILGNAVKPADVEKPKPEVKVSPPAPKAPKVAPTPKSEEKVVQPTPQEEVKSEPVVEKVEDNPAPVETQEEILEKEMADVPDEGGVFVPFVAESIKDLKVTGPQRSAISRIIDVRTKWAMEGKLPVAEYNAMSADYAGIVDQKSGADFITKYRVVGKLV